MPQMKSSRAKNGIKTNILILCIVLSMLGLGIVYGLDFFESRATQVANDKGTPVEFTIAASKLQAPESWIVSEFNPEQTILNLLQLHLTMNLDGQSFTLNLTLMPAARAAPSAYLLDSLYIHNFAPGRSDQMYGLVVKKLKNEAGFEDETVWYDALSATPFVAKCLEEKVAVERAKNCITTVLVNKRVSALIQFEKAILPHWRQFSVALNKQMAEFNVD
jgi:hypothetical protein